MLKLITPGDCQYEIKIVAQKAKRLLKGSVTKCDMYITFDYQLLNVDFILELINVTKTLSDLEDYRFYSY